MPYPKVQLDGAVVAVTGGARGIGKATSGSGLVNAVVPEPVMRLGRKLIGDRRGLTSIEHDVRAAYEQATHAQARMAER